MRGVWVGEGWPGDPREEKQTPQQPTKQKTEQIKPREKGVHAEPLVNRLFSRGGILYFDFSVYALSWSWIVKRCFPLAYIVEYEIFVKILQNTLVKSLFRAYIVEGIKNFLIFSKKVRLNACISILKCV